MHRPTAFPAAGSSRSSEGLRVRLRVPLLSLAVALPAFAAEALDEGAGSRPAPGFSLPGREGTVTLDSFRGHLVYVDFWASWCGPCESSFPWLASLHERYSAKGLVIVA